MNICSSDINKIVMVTGGAQGIGKGISLKLMEERYHVIVVDKDEEAGRELVSGFGKVFDVEFIPADVSDWDAVNQLLNHVARHHGRLDALVNNTADTGTDADAYIFELEELEREDWPEKMDANPASVMACVKNFASLLKVSRGSIVNIASTSSLMSEPQTETYTASKGGIVALTRALANRLGPEVRVNVVSPGWIEVSDWKESSAWETPDPYEINHRPHAAVRGGIPKDIADMVAFLLCKRAEFITGQNIVVDGGMTRQMIYKT